MIPVPNHLKEIAKTEKSKKGSITLRIVCTCGCDNFNISENKVTKTEAQIKWEKEMADFGKRCKWRSWYIERLKDGELYACRKFLGKIVDKVRMIDNSKLDVTEIIKIKCGNCGKDYTVFDSRYNGYDSMETTSLIKQKTYDFKQKRIKKAIDDLVKIKIVINNDETLEEFIEASGIQADNEFYANAFSWIKIIGIISNQGNKHVTIFEKETR